ncbi:uncharacterized protein LOC141907521 [Tubulanus polymorphus]|uniref:uncharacterized protein LOC141907521 n=1 Tax=Tubulanus polymorphus TaxID=672921 RepID=UPI003DA5FAB7
MMLRNCFVLMCVVVLLQLGNIHSTELSRMRRKRRVTHIEPRPVPTGQLDRKTQGQEIVYKCKLAVGKSKIKAKLIFQQKCRGSESWGPVRGGIQPRSYNQYALALAELKFKADFKLHNGTAFRCLVKENPTNPEPIRFDVIVFLRLDNTTTDPPKTTSDPHHRTIVILYITCGATGFILIVLIAVFTIRRCRRRSPGEGHVETSTPPPRLKATDDVLLNVYEDPDDGRNSDNVSNRKPVRKSETRLHNVQTRKSMRAEKGKYTTVYMDMEAEKGKHATIYMDMGAGKGKDTSPYMDMEAGKDKDTSPYMDMEAGKGTDKVTYMNLDAKFVKR